MPIMAAITSGSLYLQVKGLLRSQKVKKYGVLFGKTPDSHPYLGLYDSKEDYENFLRSRKKCEIKKIDLHNIRTINNQTQSSGKGKEYQMEIRTKREKTTLLFDTEAESREWSGHLNSLVASSDKFDENSTSSVLDNMTTSGDDHDDSDDIDSDDDCVTVNQMYGGLGEVSRFEVTVDDTELATLCGISGKRTLVVGETSIAFENVNPRRIDCTFQFAWLRRFGKKEGVLTFEVGRKCPQGPGEIKCRSDSAKLIHKLVSEKSHSRGATVTPKKSQGIGAAQDNIKHVIEKQIELVEPEDGKISGPVLHIQKRHPGLGSVQKLIPLNVTANNNTENGNSSTTSDREFDKRSSAKSLDGGRTTSKHSGSIKHGPVLDDFTKHLEHAINEPQNKDKEKESKKKEQDRKREERENKKKEEKREKERKKEEKKQKEKAKKDEEKAKKDEKKEKKDEKKERVQPATPSKPVGKSPGFYEEVDILDSTPSPDSRPNISHGESHYSEALENEGLYDEANSPAQANPVEYSTPIKNRTPYAPCEYSDVKTLKGNAWKSLGRTEEEEEHNENYSEIKKARSLMEGSPPPLPGRSYDPEEEEEDDTYNRITLKSSHTKDKPKNKAKVETQNIYGLASAKEVGPLDEGQEDMYDTPQFDAYDCPSDLVSSNRPVDSYEEVKQRPPPIRRKPEESLYDEVS